MIHFNPLVTLALNFLVVFCDDKLVIAATLFASSYVRWGRTTCEGDARVVYTGYASGSKYNEPGSGSNYLCLHDSPQWKNHIPGFQSLNAYAYGIEYEMFNAGHTYYNNIFSHTNNGGWPILNHPAPCVLCYLPERQTVTMIPARVTCPAGWTKEYGGYVVSNHRGYTRTNFICWDEAPETAIGGTNQDQAVIYPTEVMCGSLPCSRYPSGFELACVVCSAS